MMIDLDDALFKLLGVTAVSGAIVEPNGLNRSELIERYQDLFGRGTDNVVVLVDANQDNFVVETAEQIADLPLGGNILGIRIMPREVWDKIARGLHDMGYHVFIATPQ